MKRRDMGKDRLIAPDDFTSPPVIHVPGKVKEDLIPPSHFASNIQPAAAHRGAQITGPPPPVSWIKPGLTSVQPGDPVPANPWLAITQAQQEIAELRKENQRIMMLQENRTRGRIPTDYPSDLRARSDDRSEQWSRWESELRLEAEKHKAEVKRLRGQVDALKESEGRHREERREKDNTLNRQSHELEAMRKELCKAKTELCQIRDELAHCSGQKAKISSQLKKVEIETGEAIAQLRRDIDRRKEEVRELSLRAETSRSQAEEEAKCQILMLSESLEEMQRKQEVELQRLNASHSAELDTAMKTNNQLEERLQSMTSEVLGLKSALVALSTERDELKENLSQTGHAFETQSATLHSLRNYIGQLTPEKQEKEQLNEAVERLNREKTALQMTAELLTIRLNSVNEMLSLQEEKIVKEAFTDPHVMNGSDGLRVIRLWREKVFSLCVQLYSKDIELRGEKDKILSKFKTLEQQLEQEKHRACVLRHSLDDRIAELDLERVEKEMLKQDLAQADMDNSELKSQCQKSMAEIKILSEAVHRFRLAFENKVAEVDAAQTRVSTFIQRLIFAKRRVETIQGLLMRRLALQNIQQASKEAVDSLTNVQTELTLVCEERDKLTQELKRTPELIDKALAVLKEQYESKCRQQQQELEQSRAEVRQAVAGREEAERSLRYIQERLKEREGDLERLRSELRTQQEHSQQDSHLASSCHSPLLGGTDGAGGH